YGRFVCETGPEVWPNASGTRSRSRCGKIWPSAAGKGPISVRGCSFSCWKSSVINWPTQRPRARTHMRKSPKEEESKEVKIHTTNSVCKRERKQKS
ncbi:hypothetical protein CpipJ_CPIJ005380, partial [Culex quinquefasciatus]